MTASRLFELFIALLYLGGSLIYPLGLAWRQNLLKRAATWASMAAFVLHTVDLVMRLTVTGTNPLQQGQFYMSLLGWIFVLIFLCCGGNSSTTSCP